MLTGLRKCRQRALGPGLLTLNGLLVVWSPMQTGDYCSLLSAARLTIPSTPSSSSSSSSLTLLLRLLLPKHAGGAYAQKSHTLFSVLCDYLSVHLVSPRFVYFRSHSLASRANLARKREIPAATKRRMPNGQEWNGTRKTDGWQPPQPIPHQPNEPNETVTEIMSFDSNAPNQSISIRKQINKFYCFAFSNSIFCPMQSWKWVSANRGRLNYTARSNGKAPAASSWCFLTMFIYVFWLLDLWKQIILAYYTFKARNSTDVSYFDLLLFTFTIPTKSLTNRNWIAMQLVPNLSSISTILMIKLRDRFFQMQYIPCTLDELVMVVVVRCDWNCLKNLSPTTSAKLRRTRWEKLVDGLASADIRAFVLPMCCMCVLVVVCCVRIRVRAGNTCAMQVCCGCVKTCILRSTQSTAPVKWPWPMSL